MHKHELIRRLSPVSRAVSEKTLMSVSSSLFEAIDTPRSLAAYILLKNKEYAQLVNLEIDSRNYQCPERFADDYLVTKFLSKFPDFSHEDLDPEGAALASFYKYEEACRLTNVKFAKLEEDPSLWDPTMHRVFLLARRKISFVLRRPDLDRISDSFTWGPGATSAAGGHLTSAYVKYKSRLDVTSNSLVMGHCCINSLPSWVNCQLQTDEFPSIPVSLTREALNVVRGNEIVFVPKNAKTHRIIAKEPHVNSYLQKGFGSEIRRLLRIRAGVNLKDQTCNQRLAREGSLTGALATIDLSGASDTISQELVRFLLPHDWFSLLDQIRSKQGYVQKTNTWIYYHKFSSMGNACTFELESLIFWSLCDAALEVEGQGRTLSVYGDDLIVPTECYGAVVKVIEFAGFAVNLQKSFSSGAFRESCGKDYFNGTDVRPIFLKESLSNVESIFKLANSVRRYSHSRSSHYGCDYRFHAAWSGLFEGVHCDFRGFRIPDGFGDSGFIANFDEALPSLPRATKSRESWGGFEFKALIRLPVKRGMKDRHAGYTATLGATSSNFEAEKEELDSDDPFGIVCRSYGTKYHSPNIAPLLTGKESLPLLGHHDLRKMTYPKVTRIHTHGWYDLGPWLKP